MIIGYSKNSRILYKFVFSSLRVSGDTIRRNILVIEKNTYGIILVNNILSFF